MGSENAEIYILLYNGISVVLIKNDFKTSQLILE